MQTTRQERIKTARRPGADAIVSLLKRRAWYADPPKPDDPPGPNEGEGDEIPDWMKDPVKVAAEIKKLREESAEGRQAKKKLKELEAQQQTGADQELAEQKKYKELLDKRDKELADAKAQLAQRDAVDLRRKVAKDAGLPEEFAGRLQGATEEDLKADAAALKKLIPATTPEQPPDPKNPQQRQRQTTPNPTGDPAKETDAQRRARIFGGSTGMFEVQGNSGLILHDKDQ